METKLENGHATEPKPPQDNQHTSPPPVRPNTLGHHLGRRLVQIGITDVFSVPGDSNLTLLDDIVTEPELNLVGCCNELNAGYAADGYARAHGVSACVVTFTVGGLSMINAIAGAYGEDVPVICIVGAPNSNDYGSNKKILHHTIGFPGDFSLERKLFKHITCHQAVVNSLEDARQQIDAAIAACLKKSKPVYISISCNLLGIPHSTFVDEPLPLFFPPRMSDKIALKAAVEETTKILNNVVKPVLVGGPKLRIAKACDAFHELVVACGYALAIMPTAKGMVSEHHPHFIGTYWGVVSTPFCAEIVDNADASLFVGPRFDEFSSVGYTLCFKKGKAVIVEPDRVIIPNKPSFENVVMEDFLKKLAKRLKYNKTAFDNYERMYIPEGTSFMLKCRLPKEPLRVNVLFKHIQNILSSNMVVFSEAGDSWFQCQKLKLPQGCMYEVQLLYGSIGWAVGATLGYALGAPGTRVVACLGDGSFQMAAQEVSTMLRCGQNNIIFLINNGGYTTEIDIRDGPYNVIKNWDYTGLVDSIRNGEGKCWTAKVHCEEELIAAIETALGDKNDSLCFIEAIVHRDDASRELLQFVSMVGANGSRPPIH